jgi:hypothetical protein
MQQVDVLAEAAQMFADSVTTWRRNIEKKRDHVVRTWQSTMAVNSGPETMSLGPSMQVQVLLYRYLYFF